MGGGDLVRGGAPVVVTRTFSKLYGLGGLRVGYGIAAPEVIEALRVVREAFCANAIGQAAATAALGDAEHARRSRELNKVEKARLAGALAGRGHTVLPSLGNFVTFDAGEDGRALFRRLRFSARWHGQRDEGESAAQRGAVAEAVRGLVAGARGA